MLMGIPNIDRPTRLLSQRVPDGMNNTFSFYMPKSPSAPAENHVQSR